MNNAVKVLVVEDSEEDAALTVQLLQRGGFAVHFERVDTARAVEEALSRQCWDAVISDYQMPSFSGLDALKIVRTGGSDIPFILVSGTVGEEIAVEAMKAGVNDFVIKSKLSRLAQVLERELREAANRAGRRYAQEQLREREAGLQRAQAMARLAHVITGPKGEFLSWSETLPQLIGVKPAEMVRSTREWLELVHPDDRMLFRRKSIEAGTTGAQTYVEYRLLHAGGAWLHFRQTMEPLAGKPDAAGNTRWFNTIQDITEQKQAEQRIGRLNRVYAVLSGINSLIVRAGDREELFREACRIAVDAGKFKLAWLGVVNREAQRVDAVAWHGTGEDYIRLMLLGLGEAGSASPGMAGQAVSERSAVISDDMTRDPRVKLGKEAGERGFHSLAILPLLVAGEAVGVLALYAGETGFFDEEEMKLLVELAGDIAFALDHIGKKEKLDYLAYYDSLTGLANRTLFHERLALHVQAAESSRSKLAVVVADIERFRIFNDSLGRQGGDAMLKQLAERLARAAGRTEIARIGADQFAIVLPNVKGRSQIGRAVEEIWRSCLKDPFKLNGADIRMAMKGGIALFPSDGSGADSLFRNAEAAWKATKRSGERYLFHSPEMTARIAESLTLETRLRQALEKEEYVLHYQPKVDLETRRIVGVEALIRWNSPGHGLVPPMKFIPLLEETGLILQVGSWALQRAALDHSHWLRQGLAAPRIAVNVSAIQLRQRNFVEMVKEATSQGVNPTAIDVELTESLLMEDVAENIKKLKALRDLGMIISIDDFGTGYSSLGYLAKLPVHALKIDRSFIITMLTEPDTMTLISTIISLALSLKLNVVAEGVEHEEQAKLLRLLRCHQMQGYLFSKPLPLDQMTALLVAG